MEKFKVIVFIVSIFFFLFSSSLIAQEDRLPARQDTVATNNSLKVSLKVLDDSLICITVTNVSQSPISAYSYVKTYENHYDYFEIEAVTPDYDKMYFSFWDSREKSAPIIVILKPQESFSHTINLIAWSERSINQETLKRAGLNHLPHGIKIRAKYRNSPCTNCNEYYKAIWAGYIYSEWVKF